MFGSSVSWYHERCGGSSASAVREVGQRAVDVVAGQRVHEVEIEVVEAGGLRELGCADRLVGPVHAAELPELLRAEALHADRQAVHARGAVRGETLGLDGPGFASSVTSAPGASGARARMPSSSRRIAAPENKLGVPPPMNTLASGRSCTSGSSASRSRSNASTYASSAASPRFAS